MQRVKLKPCCTEHACYRFVSQTSREPSALVSSAQSPQRPRRGRSRARSAFPSSRSWRHDLNTDGLLVGAAAVTVLQTSAFISQRSPAVAVQEASASTSSTITMRSEQLLRRDAFKRNR
ncbi:hypothetical protein ACJJTC_006511 [Scirpophaga incertulas]